MVKGKEGSINTHKSNFFEVLNLEVGDEDLYLEEKDNIDGENDEIEIGSKLMGMQTKCVLDNYP